MSVLGAVDDTRLGRCALGHIRKWGRDAVNVRPRGAESGDSGALSTIPTAVRVFPSPEPILGDPRYRRNRRKPGSDHRLRGTQDGSMAVEPI